MSTDRAPIDFTEQSIKDLRHQIDSYYDVVKLDRADARNILAEIERLRDRLVEYGISVEPEPPRRPPCQRCGRDDMEGQPNPDLCIHCLKVLADRFPAWFTDLYNAT